MSVGAMAAFKSVVFTRDGDVRYVNEIMSPEGRKGCQVLVDFGITDEIYIAGATVIPDGQVLLVSGRNCDGAKKEWLDMYGLIRRATLEGWEYRHPPEGYADNDGMWDGNGEWFAWDTEEELPPQEI